MEVVIKAVGAVVLAVVALAFFAAVMAYPTMWIVNYLFAPSAIAAVFGVSQLTFCKALALSYVSGALIKGTNT